jgi:signal transduction histidine kinase
MRRSAFPALRRFAPRAARLSQMSDLAVSPVIRLDRTPPRRRHARRAARPTRGVGRLRRVPGPSPLAAAALPGLRVLSAALGALPHALAVLDGRGAPLRTVGNARNAARGRSGARACVRAPDGACAGAVRVHVGDGADTPERRALAALAADAATREWRRRRDAARLALLEPQVHLAAFTVHELGGPVSTLLGFLELLSTRASGRDGDELLRHACECAERMRDTLREMQLLGGARERLRRADAGGIAREALLEVRIPSSVPVRVQEPRGPLAVRCHPGLLRRALRNLLANAAEAVRGAGQVGVRIEPAGRRVRLSVWDDGPGVPADRVAGLFSTPATTKPTGTGIGLLLVRSIVERVHGGRVSYVPRSPHGAEFRIDLPRA